MSAILSNDQQIRDVLAQLFDKLVMSQSYYKNSIQQLEVQPAKTALSLFQIPIFKMTRAYI